MSRMGTIGDAAVIPCAISNTRVMKAIKDRNQPGGVSVLITCQKCEKIDAMKAQSQWDPQRVARSFRSSGWEVDAEGRSARCPDCKKRRREAHPEIPIGKPVAPPPVIDGPMDVVSSDAVRIVRVASPLSLVPAPAPSRVDQMIEEGLAEAAAAMAMLDEPEPEVAQPAEAPRSRRPGKTPGTINHYKPKICAYKPCSREFVPTGPKQKFHRIECQRASHGRPVTYEAMISAERGLEPRSPGRKPVASKPLKPAAAPPKAPAPDPAATAPPQTPEALKAERKMYTLLDEHYLGDARHYAAGWDDVRVSTESGVAIARVQFVREGLYGKAIDPYLLALKGDVEAVLERIKAERITLQALVRDTFDRQEKELRELLARTAARGA